MATGEDVPVRLQAVRLQSSDGKTFAVPLNVVRVSRTLDTMLKGECVCARALQYILFNFDCVCVCVRVCVCVCRIRRGTRGRHPTP